MGSVRSMWVWGVEQINLEATVATDLRDNESLNPLFLSERWFAS